MKALCESLEKLISESDLLFLQFGNEFCSPCRAIRLRVDVWLDTHPAVARYVDVPAHISLCAQMGILSVPAVVVFMDGKEIIRAAGCFSLERIFSQIERYSTMRGSETGREPVKSVTDPDLRISGGTT